MADADLARPGARVAAGPVPERLWPLGAALVIAVLTWPVASVTPGTGLDPSWRIGLAMAFRDRMSWGDDLVFSYGPLGFLENPVNVSVPGLALALLWTFLVQAVLALTIILAARRSLPWWVGVALAFLVGILGFDNREAVALIVFLWCAMAVAGDVGDRLGRVLVPLSGAVCAVALLDKVNVGVVCMVLAAIGVPWLPPRGLRAIAIAAGTFVVTFAVLWPALGGAFGEVVPWLRRSAEVASGFTGALLAEDQARGWEIPAFALGVAALAYLAWQYGMPRERARAACLAAAGAVMAFAYFKHGFVRHDFAHSLYTFVVLMTAPVAFVWRGVAGRVAAGALLVVGVLVTCGVVAEGDQPSLGGLFDPHDRAANLARQAFDAVRPGTLAEQRDAARAGIRDALAIPPEMIAEIGDGTVHVDPYETSAVWGYGLRWRPVPVFQAYSAYTHDLDRLDADALRAADGPDWILRERVARIGTRGRENEAPTYTIAMFCDYTERMHDDRWQLLQRTPGRCGPARDLGRREADAGAAVPVPSGRPGELVFARFDMDPGIGYRLRTLLYRPRSTPLEVLNDDYGTNFSLALAPGDFLMRVPDTLGYSDYASGFGASRLRMIDVPSPYGVTFHAVEMAPPAEATRRVGP
jgi:hypothetical protein